MKKIYKSLIMFPLLALSLSSCGARNVNIDRYFLDVEANDKLATGYRILQLSDLHFNLAANLNEDKIYLDRLMYEAKPDYIVITGDTFMNATIREVDFAFSYFDSVGVPWSIVWGNHDKEGRYTSRELLGMLNKCKNVKFIDHFNDNVYGDSNYVVNLKSNNETKWRLVMLDSNSYYNKFGSIEYEYDSLHDNQIEWYKNVIEYENTTNIPSLVFMHIPTHEYLEAFNNNNEYTGEKEEGIHPGYKNSGFISMCKKLNSTKGVFVGHDHNNNFAINHDGIILSFGVKTGINCYHNEKIGGQVITLSDSQTLNINSIERIYLNYEF